jgi:hypothetical protein
MNITLQGVQWNNHKVGKSGRPYVAHTVTYMDESGQTKQKDIFPGSPVEGTLRQCSPGEQVQVVTATNTQGFPQWTGLTKMNGQASSATAASTATYNRRSSSSSNSSSIGMRVGNITNGAVALCSAGKAASLQEAAAAIIELQTQIEQCLTTGTPMSASTQASSEEQPDNQWTIYDSTNQADAPF